MRKIEWLIALLFIVIGLHCLVTACTLLPGPVESSGYFSFLIQICFWMGIPVLGVSLIYMIAMITKKQKGKLS